MRQDATDTSNWLVKMFGCAVLKYDVNGAFGLQFRFGDKRQMLFSTHQAQHIDRFMRIWFSLFSGGRPLAALCKDVR